MTLTHTKVSDEVRVCERRSEDDTLPGKLIYSSTHKKLQTSQKPFQTLTESEHYPNGCFFGLSIPSLDMATIP